MKRNFSKKYDYDFDDKNVKITPETLKNGDVLCALIIRFLKNRSKENMITVLSCLRDSSVFMPAQVAVSSVQTEAPNNIIYPAVGNVVVKPQLMKATDGNTYLPVFSREINSKAGQLKNSNLVNLPYLECVKILDDIEGCTKIVVDPLLYNLVLDEDLIRVSKEIPSRLEKE